MRMHGRTLVSLSSTALLLSFALPAAASGKLPPSAAQSCPSSSGGIVQAEEILLALKETGSPLDCRGRTIRGDLRLFELPARPVSPGKEERVIERALRFQDAVFLGAILTRDQQRQLRDPPRVRFAGSLDFNSTRFEQEASFDGAVFEADANFGNARFQKMASFTEAIFKERVTFRSAQFEERALFTRAHFWNQADFAIATFNWIAFFLESTFSYPPQEGANFLFTRFNGDAVFARAMFAGIARFVGTRFRGPAHFSDAVFKREAWFAGGARFDDTVTFRRATQFPDPDKEASGSAPRARFNGVVFAGDANFADAKFDRVSFDPGEKTEAFIGADTVFQRRADFSRTTFASLDLRRVIFQSEVRFSGADLGTKVEVTGLDITRAVVHMTWGQLLDHGNPKFFWGEVFSDAKLSTGDKGDSKAFFDFLAAVERNFRARSQLEDAGDVHYLAEDLERSKRSLGYRMLDSIFLKGAYGYGVRPWNQVCLALLLIVGFGCAYTKIGLLREEEPQQRTLRLRITDIPVDWSGRTSLAASDSSAPGRDPGSVRRRFWRGLVFSSYVFTKVGFGGVVARRSHAAVVIAEWLIGLVVWIIFLTNLSMRWPLLHRLVTMTSL